MPPCHSVDLAEPFRMAPQPGEWAVSSPVKFEKKLGRQEVPYGQFHHSLVIRIDRGAQMIELLPGTPRCDPPP